MAAKPPTTLTAERIGLIKRLLAEGRTQEHIAAIVGVAQASVSRIKTGEMGAEVQWPSGQTGELPAASYEKRVEKWSHKAQAYLSFPEEMQVHILDVVNEQRREAGWDEVPPADPTYMSYLQQEQQLSLDERATSLEKAVDSEDRRIVRVMEEFQQIMDAEAQRARDDELFSMLENTAAQPRADDEDDRGTRSLVTGASVLTPVLVYDALTTGSLLEMAGKVPIVIEAMADTEGYLEKACCILFYQMKGSDPRSFKEPFVEKEVRRLAAKLRGRDLQE